MRKPKLTRQQVRRRMRSVGIKRPGGLIRIMEQQHGRRVALTVCALAGIPGIVQMLSAARPPIAGTLDTDTWTFTPDAA